MRFSIIIPVYNVEKYIRRCMETVMGQTFRDYEVIVVDDESPDHSMEIVSEFSEKYPGMMKIIHQKNTGLGGARNRGVQEAQGEYLLFVDSDDYVSADLLETVDKQLKEHTCDMLVFKYRLVTPDGKPLQEGGFGSLTPGMYVPGQHRQIITMPVSAVNKVYRRPFYQEYDFRFLEGVLYEDTITRFLMAKASGIYLHDAELYYYVQSPGSIMRKKPSSHVLDILKVTDTVIERFQKDGCYADYQMELDASLLIGLLHLFDWVNRADRKDPMLDTFASYIREHFCEYESNPCISRENKRAIACILSGKYTYYHYRFVRKLELVEGLMSHSFMIRLNKERKRLLALIRKG